MESIWPKVMVIVWRR